LLPASAASLVAVFACTYAEFAIANTEVTNEEKSLDEFKFSGCIFVSAMCYLCLFGFK
jgi:tellurite resistance protein TehA-like permease